MKHMQCRNYLHIQYIQAMSDITRSEQLTTPPPIHTHTLDDLCGGECSSSYHIPYFTTYRTVCKIVSIRAAAVSTII